MLFSSLYVFGFRLKQYNQTLKIMHGYASMLELSWKKKKLTILLSIDTIKTLGCFSLIILARQNPEMFRRPFIHKIFISS